MKAGQGRERLVGVASRLQKRLLDQAVEARKDRLSRVRLTPALVGRPVAQAQDRLNALARLAEQLHPKKPLERGYAIVRSAEGAVLTNRAEAEAHAAFRLEFKDGEMQVGSGAPSPAKQPPPPPKRKPRSKPTSPSQEDLFG